MQSLFGLSKRLTDAGVEHLLRDVKDSTVSDLSSEVSHMASGLRALKSRLSEVQEYLDLVLEGRLPVNHDIMYHLQACYTPFILIAVLNAWTLCCFPDPISIPQTIQLGAKHHKLQSQDFPSLGYQYSISQCLHFLFPVFEVH